MNWKRNTKDSKTNQKYYMVNGTKTICKVSVNGKWLYELWDGGKFIERADTFEALQNKV
jgi:hypothetical protein